MPRRPDTPPTPRQREPFPGIDPPIPGIFEPAAGDVVVSFDVLDEADPADEPTWTLVTPLPGAWHPHGEPVRTEGGALEIRFRNADAPPEMPARGASARMGRDAPAPRPLAEGRATPHPLKAPADTDEPRREPAASTAAHTPGPPITSQAPTPARPASPPLRRATEGVEQVDVRGHSWLAPQLPSWIPPAAGQMRPAEHLILRDLPDDWPVGTTVGLTVGGSRELTADPAAESSEDARGDREAGGGPSLG